MGRKSRTKRERKAHDAEFKRAYLRKKEAFISSGRLGMAAGEEALLGHYVGALNKEGEHDFVVPAAAGDRPLVIDESRWHGFLDSGERRRKLEADQISYLWDSLIEQFRGHYMSGTSHLRAAIKLPPMAVGSGDMANADGFSRRPPKHDGMCEATEPWPRMWSNGGPWKDP